MARRCARPTGAERAEGLAKRAGAARGSSAGEGGGRRGSDSGLYEHRAGRAAERASVVGAVLDGSIAGAADSMAASPAPARGAGVAGRCRPEIGVGFHAHSALIVARRRPRRHQRGEGEGGGEGRRQGTIVPVAGREVSERASALAPRVRAVRRIACEPDVATPRAASDCKAVDHGGGKAASISGTPAPGGDGGGR